MLRVTWILVAYDNSLGFWLQEVSAEALKLAIKLECLNTTSSRDRSRADRILPDIPIFGVDVAAIRKSSEEGCSRK